MNADAVMERLSAIVASLQERARFDGSLGVALAFISGVAIGWIAARWPRRRLRPMLLLADPRDPDMSVGEAVRYIMAHADPPPDRERALELFAEAARRGRIRFWYARPDETLRRLSRRDAVACVRAARSRGVMLGEAAGPPVLLLRRDLDRFWPRRTLDQSSI